jgi:hypothetical protein
LQKEKSLQEMKREFLQPATPVHFSYRNLALHSKKQTWKLQVTIFCPQKKFSTILQSTPAKAGNDFPPFIKEQFSSDLVFVNLLWLWIYTAPTTQSSSSLDIIY